mgnify:CR=1 FL=1
MYKINEIFYSLQGEGANTGTAAVFVRFSGCNLQCEFCDTDHAEGKLMTALDIVDAVARYTAAPLVVLTGGEPALFIDNDLVSLLHGTGKTVAIETNGTSFLPVGIDWVTLSPKTGVEGGELKPLILSRCNELKVVYTGQDLAQYDHITAEHRFLQPCYVDDEEQRRHNIDITVEAVKQHPEWRLSLQTHRLIGIR